jgi:hypothetical protein
VSNLIPPKFEFDMAGRLLKKAVMPADEGKNAQKL